MSEDVESRASGGVGVHPSESEWELAVHNRIAESFLTTPTWATVRKKIRRSNEAWAPKKSQ